MSGIDISQVAAVVVWLNPSEKEVGTIKLYRDDLKRILVVDNSSEDHQKLVAGMDNVEYILLGENKGIATAQNVGCRRAVELGFQWVLTMDQDSEWKIDSVSGFIAEANQYTYVDKVAIFSPLHVCNNGHHHKHRRRFERRKELMCSGNLLRLAAWQQAEGFRDDFFIDYVDTEMCFHIRKMGWKLIRVNHIRLLHSLGNATAYSGHKKHGYALHPAWRYFYMGRNCRWMMRLYPWHIPSLANAFLRELRHVWLYDTTEDRSAKIDKYFEGWKAGKGGPSPFPSQSTVFR